MRDRDTPESKELRITLKTIYAGGVVHDMVVEVAQTSHLKMIMII